MKLENLSPAYGSTKRRKRVGRGGKYSKTAGAGEKGQNARSGGGVRLGFEGGQLPLFRRLGKRGFNNARFRTVYATVNVSDLNRFEENTVVTPELLFETGMVKKQLDGIKVLYNKAKADNQEDTFSTPYASEPIETAYGFHLVYALGFAAQTELPTVEELTIYNLLQDAANYKDATVDYKVEIYENTVKTLKEKYDIVYYDEETQTTYEMDKEVTAKIDAWYTANLQEVANKAFTKDLINAIETLEIKVPSEQAEFDRIKAEIVRVSKKDLEAEDNK